MIIPTTFLHKVWDSIETHTKWYKESIKHLARYHATLVRTQLFQPLHNLEPFCTTYALSCVVSGWKAGQSVRYYEIPPLPCKQQVTHPCRSELHHERHILFRTKTLTFQWRCINNRLAVATGVLTSRYLPVADSNSRAPETFADAISRTCRLGDTPDNNRLEK